MFCYIRKGRKGLKQATGKWVPQHSEKLGISKRQPKKTDKQMGSGENTPKWGENIKKGGERLLLQTKYLCPVLLPQKKSHAEALTPSVALFEAGATKEVIMVK